MKTRRDVIATTIGAAAFAAAVGESAAQPLQKTFVLVHGGFGGGWVWRRVADLLEKAGHKVFTPTLTGLGERSHLLNAQVNLTTHVTDIASVIKWERLEDIVLVGHSYGGVVITGVAERAEMAIASIVFLDAFVPENGQALADIALGAAGLVRTATERGQIAVPPFSAESFRVNEKDRAWVDAMCTPQPIATFTEKLLAEGARERIARKTYVRVSGYPNAALDAAYAKCRSTPGWRTHEMPCGHYAMVDMPDGVADILLKA
jgi:pimeloyl-ACP methyl ester carboxylesterase